MPRPLMKGYRHSPIPSSPPTIRTIITTADEKPSEHPYNPYEHHHLSHQMAMATTDWAARLRRQREDFHAGRNITDPGPPPPQVRPLRISQHMQPLTERNKENLPPDRLAMLDAATEQAARAARERGRTLAPSWTAPPGLGERMQDLRLVGRGAAENRVALGDITVVAPVGARHVRSASRPENVRPPRDRRRAENVRHDVTIPVLPVPEQVLTSNVAPRTRERRERLDTGRMRSEEVRIRVVPVRRVNRNAMR